MRYLLLLLAAGTLSACASALVESTPEWDRHFGAATRALLAQQIIHPDARRNTDPVNGMDGRAALGAYERYQKGQTEAAQSLMQSGAK